MGFFELDTEAAAKAKAAWEEKWEKVVVAKKAWAAVDAWEAEEKKRTLGKE